MDSFANDAANGASDTTVPTEHPSQPTRAPRHRAEDVLPSGYRAVGTIDLDKGARVHVIDVADLDAAGEAFGSLRLLADVMATGANKGVAELASSMAGFWQQRMRVLAAGTMVLALIAGLGALSVGLSPAASAATVATAGVPAMESPQPDPAPTRHVTEFGRGYWFDQCQGAAYVAAPLLELVPSVGWVPSPWAKVVVQELTPQGVRYRGTLTRTDAYGMARGLVRIGGGVHYLRVAHPADFWTAGTVGTWRRVVVTTEPCDVI